MFDLLQKVVHLLIISVGTFLAPTLIVILVAAVVAYILPHFWQREKGLELSPPKLISASPWLTLIVCLILTLVSWMVERHAGHRDAQVQFARETLRLQDKIAARLQGYDDLLREAQDFMSTQKVDGGLWQGYVGSLHLEDKFPMVYGLGYAAYVPEDRLIPFQRSVRAIGLSQFTVFPAGNRFDYFPIVYVEPNLRNNAIVGFDLGSDILARTAAESSRQTNRPTLTARVTLLDDPEHRAFLYFLPVSQVGTFKGWVFTRFRQEEFLLNIMPPNINLQAFDDASMTRESLFFDSSGFAGDWQKNRQGPFASTVAISVGDRHWTLHFSARQSYEEQFTADRTAAVFGIGLLFSAGLFGLVWAFSSSRRRAYAWAQELTSHIRLREAALLSGPHGILITDATQPDNPLTYVSPQFEKLTGYSSDDVIGRNPRFLEGDDKDQKGLQTLRLAIRDGRETRVLLRNYRKDGTPFWNDLTLTPVRNEKGRLVQWAGVLQDVTEREQSERRLTTQIGVIRALSESTSLLDASSNTLRAICEGQDWELGAMWSLDVKANVLRCVDIWHAPDTLVPEFEMFSRQTTYPREMGLPGHVWARGEAVWLSDMVKEANFPESTMLLKEGLRSACGFPIANRRGLQGVLTFYGKKIWPLNRNLMLLMVGAGTQMSQYLERQSIEAQQQELTALERGMAEFIGEGLLAMDREGLCIYANASSHRLLGYPAQLLLGKKVHEVLHPSNLGQATCNPAHCPIALSLQYSQPVEVEVPQRIWKQDKSTLMVSYITSPIIDQGMVQGAVITFRDASERSRNEHELRSRLVEKEAELQKVRQALEAQSVPASTAMPSGAAQPITPSPAESPAPPVVINLPAAVPQTVLLLEENFELREQCAKALREAGFQALVTGHTDEAVRWAGSPGQTIDVVVTDVLLPHSTGKAFVERLRPWSPRIKVLYASAYTPSAIKDLAGFEDGTPFLQKPFTPEALLEQIRQMLRS